VSILAAAVPTDYEAPGIAEFWQPLIGEGAWAITRPAFLMVISAVLLLWYLFATTRKMSLVPSRGQMMTEGVYGLVRNGIARDLIGSRDFLRFVPLLFALFTTILLNNVFGILVPFSYPTMSRIGFPVALTLIVWITFHVVGMRKHGFVGYWKSLVPSGLPAAMVPAIFFLELVTDLFTRPVTLALRLFGNMFAGHILLGIIFLLTALDGLFGWALTGQIGGILIGAPAGLLMVAFTVGFLLPLKILVAFLQAFIFCMLSMLYIAGATEDAEHH
jgi:F-type H+-transporting ATPase subunit a